MANTTASPGTMANDSAVGTVAWSNSDNAKVSDDSYALTDSMDGVVSTNYLKATNFGFSIPIGATINGVEVGVEQKFTGTPTAGNLKVKLVKGGVVSGDFSDVLSISDVDTYVLQGGSTDLWENTLTAVDINSSTFGCVYYIEDANGGFVVSVDHIRTTVYYTETSSSTIAGVQTIQGIQSITL